MSLIDQPDEILIEQIRYLPLEDLLKLAQTNYQIYRVSNSPRLWQFRLIDDFAVEDLAWIKDPRKYYFELIEEREEIFRFILTGVTENYFNAHRDSFTDLDIYSYQEFVQMQREATKDLKESEIREIRALRMLLNKSQFLETNEGGLYYLNSFFFDLIAPIRKFTLISTL